MGWDYTQGVKKADIVKAILSGGDKPTEYFPIAHKVVGHCLWVVWEHDSQDKQARFIGLYLLESQKGFGWGYKSLQESMGPSEVSCPLQFLEITPSPDSPYAEEWRKKVRQYHQETAIRKAQSPGESLRSVNCGECLMAHVDVVPLNAHGKCSCCATNHELARRKAVA